MGIYGTNSLLSVSSSNVWRGEARTNGVVMRSADGRIEAVRQSFSALDVGVSHPLATESVVPWGNALWIDTGAIDTKPGTMCAQKPTKGYLFGVLEHNRGWVTGHPVQPFGLPKDSRGEVVRRGLVMYKQTMTAAGQAANYAALLKGNLTHDTGTTRKVYTDWVGTLKAAADGSKLGLFFHTASGFPIIGAVAEGEHPVLADAVFGGWVEIFEPENAAVWVRLNTDTWFSDAPVST